MERTLAVARLNGGAERSLRSLSGHPAGVSNSTPLPAKIFANERIAQVLFFRAEEEPEVSHKDKGGKCQSQIGVTLPKL